MGEVVPPVPLVARMLVAYEREAMNGCSFGISEEIVMDVIGPELENQKMGLKLPADENCSPSESSMFTVLLRST